MGDISDVYGGAYSTDHPEASTGFDALPAGWYPAEIEKAEVRDNQKKTGKYLFCQFSVVGEKFANRKLFARITLMHPNEQAVEIGQRELAGLGQACGLAAITDSQELVGKTVQVRVKVVTEDYNKQPLPEPDNEIKAYKANGAATQAATQPTQAPRQAPPAQTAPAATGQPAAATSAPSRPWER